MKTKRPERIRLGSISVIILMVYDRFLLVVASFSHRLIFVDSPLFLFSSFHFSNDLSKTSGFATTTTKIPYSNRIFSFMFHHFHSNDNTIGFCFWQYFHACVWIQRKLMLPPKCSVYFDNSISTFWTQIFWEIDKRSNIENETRKKTEEKKSIFTHWLNWIEVIVCCVWHNFCHNKSK